jgi:hypothetical protein
MEAVFEQRTNSVVLTVENLMQNDQMTHLQKVNVLIDDYLDKFIQRQQFHKIMLREQLMEKDTAIAGLIFEMKKRNLAYIKKLIQDGQKAGEFKKNIDIMLMMTTMIGTVSQMIMSQSFYRQCSHLEHMNDADFQKYMRKKLSAHLKNLFKIVLTNEA